MFAWSKLIALNSEGYFLSNTNRYFLGKDEDTNSLKSKNPWWLFLS